MNRKELKKQARARLKKCYWMLVVLCLIMAVTGIDYVSSLKSITTDTSETAQVTTSETAQGTTLESALEDALDSSQQSAFSKIITNLLNGEDNEKAVKEYISQQEKVTNKIGIVAMGHSRGVFAQMVNGVSSGQILDGLYKAMHSILRSDNVSIVFFILLSLAFMFMINVFVINVLKITIKRVVMELRLYDKVPLGRFLYILFVKRIWNVAKTMFLTNLYMLLWTLTIVGGIIKGYSYMLVPYILAENPSINSKQAITLSRKMMDGHKWEAFKLELSFFGWHLLEFFTYGISGVLFSNPYQEMTNAEYYSYLRKLAKENNIPDADLLNDEYLYEKADVEFLEDTYSDVQPYLKEAEGPLIRHTGVRGFFENVFGLTLFYDEDEMQYQDKKSKQLGVRNFKDVMDRNMYPFRLFAQRNKDHLTKLSNVQYDRHYSIFSIIFMFFTMSFIGWSWEVSLHLISDGKFVNRGILHGPWLPIYGFGGVLILVFLYKFREKVFAEFIAGVILCGAVEYSTAWFLETTYGGTKWWDYTGYFLNIHGRICAEGLLIFGLGGIAIVYLLAPFLDNHFRKIPKTISIIAAALLVLVYAGDSAYSSMNPNKGEGITNYTGSQTEETETTGETENIVIETETN